MSSHALVVALIVAGCSRVTEVRWPVPPAVPSARSMILVLADDEGGDVQAFELDAEGMISGRARLVAIAERSEPRLTALYYDRTLDDLGLAAGRLGRPNQLRDCLLADPIFIAESTGGDWIELDSSAAIASVVDARDCNSDVCRTFAITSLPLDDPADVSFSLALDEERALIGTVMGRFYVVSSTGAAGAARYDGLPSLSAALEQSGALWLGGYSGRIVRGPLSGPFEEAPSFSSGLIVALAVSPSPPSRVLALAVETTETSTYSTLVLFEVSPDPHLIMRAEDPHASIDGSELAFWGQRAIAVYRGLSMLVLDGERVLQVTVEPVRTFDEARPGSVASSGEVTLVGGSDGFLYQARSPEVWSPILEPRLGGNVQAILPFGEGFFFGGEDGAVSQYFPDRAPCPTETLVRIDLRHMTQVGSRLLVSGAARGAPSNTLYWFDVL